MYFRGIYTVEAAYLINMDGRLMYSREVELEDEDEESVDGEILSGMFTAIQDLIDDSFHTEEGKGLRKKRIEFGGKNIMIQRGDNIYLVMVVNGRPGKLVDRKLENAVAGIEQENPGLDQWGGNRDKLKVEHFFTEFFQAEEGGIDE